VREDFPVNDILLTVHASDADRGQNAELVYSLAANSAAQHGHLFTVDPESGALTLRQSLDYETLTEYSLVVAATDRGLSPTPAYTKVTSRCLFVYCIFMPLPYVLWPKHFVSTRFVRTLKIPARKTQASSVISVN